MKKIMEGKVEATGVPPENLQRPKGEKTTRAKRKMKRAHKLAFPEGAYDTRPFKITVTAADQAEAKAVWKATSQVLGEDQAEKDPGELPVEDLETDSSPQVSHNWRQKRRSQLLG